MTVVAALALGAAASSEAAPGSGVLTPLSGAGACFFNAGPDPGGGSAACVPTDQLAYARTAELSPDGRHVYVVARDSDTIRAFARDAATGLLTPAPATTGAVAMDGPSDIAFSPDGASAYVAAVNSDSIAVFTRDAMTGALTQKPGVEGCIADAAIPGCRQGRTLLDAQQLDVAPDGRVYVAAGTEGIAVLQPTAGGGLEQPAGAGGCADQDGAPGNVCADTWGLPSVRWVDVAAGSGSLYASSLNGRSVAALQRLADGAPAAIAPAGGGCFASPAADTCPLAAGLGAVSMVLVSPDGHHLYVTNQSGDALTVFGVKADGGLEIVAGGCLSHALLSGCSAVGLMDWPFEIDLSPDGAFAYLAGLRRHHHVRVPGHGARRRLPDGDVHARRRARAPAGGSRHRTRGPRRRLRPRPPPRRHWTSGNGGLVRAAHRSGHHRTMEARPTEHLGDAAGLQQGAARGEGGGAVPRRRLPVPYPRRRAARQRHRRCDAGLRPPAAAPRNGRGGPDQRFRVHRQGREVHDPAVPVSADRAALPAARGFRTARVRLTRGAGGSRRWS